MKWSYEEANHDFVTRTSRHYCIVGKKCGEPNSAIVANH